MLQPCTGRAEEVPIAPATVTAAAAAGLKRVDATELGERYGGARVLITDKGPGDPSGAASRRDH